LILLLCCAVPVFFPLEHQRQKQSRRLTTVFLFSQCKWIEKPKTQSGIRQIPMSEKVYEALGRVLENRKKAKPITIDGYSNFLFLNRDGCPKTAASYDNMFRGLAKKYNKRHEEALPKVMTPHTLRHTFCTNLANTGMNPKALQYISPYLKCRESPEIRAFPAYKNF